MTDLQKYRKFFEDSTISVKEYKERRQIRSHFDRLNGTVESTGEIVQISVPVYKEVEYTVLELVPENGADVYFEFDEDGKFHRIEAGGY